MTQALLRRCFALLAAGFLTLSATHAAEPTIIAKARAYLGSEAALNGVTSIHYLGTLKMEMNAAASTEPEQTATLEILLQKPTRQRSVMTAAGIIETTALDDYEGWRKAQDPKDASRWKIDLLTADQVKSLRANVWENLAFFRGVEGRRATIEDLGTATADGIVCHKLAFVYSPQIAFIRYFDQATGKLVLTETQQGEQIREQGVIVAGGIKFPKALVTTIKRPDGTTQIVTITFEKVAVNETFDASLFAMPSMGGQ
jgi:outer membrane lipoprotein-sorting protein